jgi:NADH-quinone oxidoreductase subunit J
MTEFLFYPLAFVALVAAVAAVSRVSPLPSALWLAVSLLAVAGLGGCLAAPAVAALFALIAAGAVVVLVLFVVMLTDPSPEARRPRQVRFDKLLGAVSAAYLAAVMLVAVVRPPFAEAPISGPAFEAPEGLGAILATRYALPFELTGVLLLAATVASVSIAKRRNAEDVMPADEEPLA